MTIAEVFAIESMVKTATPKSILAMVEDVQVALAQYTFSLEVANATLPKPKRCPKLKHRSPKAADLPRPKTADLLSIDTPPQGRRSAPALSCPRWWPSARRSR